LGGAANPNLYRGGLKNAAPPIRSLLNTMRKKTQKHRLAGGFTKEGKLVRGFIPASVRADDDKQSIMSLYGVSYSTACIWIRILNGPKYMDLK
jgi:hypothetical protein